MPGALAETGYLQAPGRGGVQSLHGGAQPGHGSGADGCVMALYQFFCLQRPRHYLAVQCGPVAEFLPQPGCRERLAQPAGHRLLQAGIGEEAAPGARVHDAALVGAEPAAGGLRRPADHRDPPGAHVLLLADHPLQPLAAVGGQRVRGVLKQAGLAAGRDRGHGRRQVDNLERRGRVLLRNRHPAAQPGLDAPPAEHVVHVE